MQIEETERLRLFLAIRIPEAVKDEIEKAQAELRETLPDNLVRWAKRDQFHLTLRFLGHVEAPRVEALTNAVHGACQGFAQLLLRAERVGFFPDARFPRVVWAGVHDRQDRLAALQRAVQSAAQDFTLEKPGELFTGHVTLGRIKAIRRLEAEALAKASSALAERLFGEWTASEIEIIRSRLSPSGSQYTSLAKIPLK